MLRAAFSHTNNGPGLKLEGRPSQLLKVLDYAPTADHLAMPNKLMPRR